MIGSCGSESYRGGGYYNAFELNEGCKWDTARTCTMSDGSFGNCTLHGLCGPSFSTDHSRNLTAGLSPSMVLPRRY